MRKPFAERLGLAALTAALLGLAGGCATKAPQSKEYSFYPPAPDQPRIQFLTGFGKEGDLGAGASFKDFVVGNDKFARPMYKPYGVAAIKGKLYVTDTQGVLVSVVDLNKRRFRPMRPDGKGTLGLPINVAVDKDGTCYVTDTKLMKVMVYDKSGNFKGALGNGSDMKPCGIALTGDRLYVTDITNHCLRVFNKSNEQPLLQIPRDGANEKARLFSPSNVAVGQDGRIYVSDSGGFRVQIYDAAGNYLRSIGEMGAAPGKFALPKGIGVDHQGRVYVVDAATQVVQVFDDQGRLLMYFGYPEGNRSGVLYLPAGLAIDYENTDLFKQYVAPGYKVEFLIYVINQMGPNKVSVFGFLQKA